MTDPTRPRRPATTGHIALAAWILTMLAVAVWLLARPRYPTTEDKREVVRAPAATREAVLSEMRAMLASLHAALRASGEGDAAALREAAAASGMSADAQSPARFPETWVALATATHQAFDSLAAHADEPPSEISTRIARITANCVTCHATYRLGRR